MRDDDDEGVRGAVLVRGESYTRNGEEIEWQGRLDEHGPAIWVRVPDRTGWIRTAVARPWVAHRLIEDYESAEDLIHDATEGCDV